MRQIDCASQPPVANQRPLFMPTSRLRRRFSAIFLAIAAGPLLALNARASVQPPLNPIAVAQVPPATEEHSDSLPLMLGLGLIALLGGGAVLVHRSRVAPRKPEVDAASDQQEAMAATIAQMTDQMDHLVQEQSKVAEQMRLLIELTSSRILGPQDLEQVFTTTLKEVRRLLEVDRLVIYRFKPDWSGYISTESVVAGLPRALSDVIADPCIPKEILLDYTASRVMATSDVTTANFHPDHLKLMERLQVKANVVLPILNEGQLFGLLIAHHCFRTHEWQPAEVTFLKQVALQLGVVLDRVTFLQAKNVESERAQLIKDIMLELSYAESAQETVLRLPVVKIRQALRTDRVVVYQFNESWQGTIIAESVDERYPKAMGAEIYDPCFAKEFVGKYQRGRVHAVENIYEAGLTECHLRQLEPFAVKANLVAPIRQGNQLLGLLIAHQCDHPRNWDVQDVAFLTQVATQVGMALDRAGLLEQKEIAAKQAQLWAGEQQQQKEELNQQLIQLLEEVEKVAGGDLTVRANITSGEIGTVADFFNVVVESLRQIVAQVKQSALQVSEAVYENESGMHELAETAQMQAQEIHRTLNSMHQMTTSIQAVADSAHQAAKVANNASATAEAGGTLMDGTVQNILSLREIIGDTAKKVKRLGEFSQEISRVISLIEKIALQTNLLAINAGIEAARAGEEGHGFAVVADEIGQLAVQSTGATREIEMIISRIQVGTSEVVQAMEQSTTQVVDGTRLIKSAKLNLEEIIHVSHQIAQFVRSISEATVSQTETSQSVMNLMKELAQVSEQISDSSRKMSGSLQVAAETTQELQVSVSAFKVEM